MKKIMLFIFLSSTFLMAQKEKTTNLNRTTLAELKMNFYEKDSTANALVLYEQANRYPDKEHNETPTIDYYYRIKIFDKSAFDLANIKIYLREEERLLDVSAYTYNLKENGTMDRQKFDSKNIFTQDALNDWKLKKFTLPNVKEGCVIEYRYRIRSPYLAIDDWNFQSDIPKIKSEFNASILGNYRYNIKLVGFQKLDVDNVTVDKKCVFVDGIGHGACAIYTYIMQDIPAFKEEDYMLSKKNYVSKISFDLKSRTSYTGEIKKFTTTWKKADENLKNYFFNNQTSKANFFRNQIPAAILEIEDDLEKAKKIYTFIQNHYTWNGDFWRNSDAKVRKAFKEKSGDIGEINLSLFNSLKAANIPAKLVVLSTRNNGLPTTIYPIIFDYNYVVVEIIIENKKYYLDATDRFLPFGQVPFRTINGEARVLDFDQESKWVKLTPKYSSSMNTNVKLKINDDNDLEGDLKISRTGYFSIDHRKKIFNVNEENYIEDFESKYIDTEVDSFKVNNLEKLEKPLSEFFKIKILSQDNLDDKIYIKPVLFGRIEINPFKLKEREFPVDYGYTRKQTYSLSLSIPDNYEVAKLPEDIAIALPNKGGSFIYKSVLNGNSINIYVRLKIAKRIFSNEEYFTLKEFYNKIIIAENKRIILKKK